MRQDNTLVTTRLGRVLPGLLALLVLGPAMIFSTPVAAKDGATMSNLPALNCAVIDVPPFGMRDDQGKTHGILVEMSHAVANAAGYGCDIKLLPYTRAIQMVGSGDADLLILYPNPKVDAVTWRAGIVVETNNILLVRRGFPAANLQVEERPLLGKMQSSFLNSVYEKTPGYAFHFIQNYAQGIKLLTRSRIDGLLGPEVAIATVLEKMQVPATDLEQPVLLNSLGAYLFVNNKHENTQTGDRLTKAVNAFYESGQGTRILDRYLPEAWRKVH